MSEISELERRITAAMDRIAAGVEQLSQPAPDSASLADTPAPEDAGAVAVADAVDNVGSTDDAAMSALQQQLDDEKMANAQLEERLKALRLKVDQQDAGEKLAANNLRHALTEMERAVKELKDTSEALRRSSETLRVAGAEGLTDAEAINAALQAELDALQAERAAEAAESLALAAAIVPLIEQKETA